jgi:hypothetical protein
MGDINGLGSIALCVKFFDRHRRLKSAIEIKRQFISQSLASLAMVLV